MTPRRLVVVVALLLVAVLALVIDASRITEQEPLTVPPTTAEPTTSTTSTTTTLPPAPPPPPSTTTTVPATTTTAAPPKVPHPSATITTDATRWDRLADCESGEWDRHGNPIPGTARWDDHRGGYEGGVHFAPSTWDGHRLDGMPDAAYLATREQQIAVAERVLASQGWGAWPVCSRKIGAR